MPLLQATSPTGLSTAAFGSVASAASLGCRLSFPTICTQRGEVLHNHSHAGVLREGSLLLLDAGCELPSLYCSDNTRTWPVGGKFRGAQHEIYSAVYSAFSEALKLMRPGIPFRDIHLSAARVLASGLKAAGLMKGDPAEAAAAGAHALFFPHGLGHMLGLDAHDMEALGQRRVGFSRAFPPSRQFGLSALRLGKKLREGFVVTCEPGCYFIKPLMEKWKAEGLHRDFINYGRLEAFKGFGGIRIEDTVLITAGGSRRLGPGIPASPSEI